MPFPPTTTNPSSILLQPTSPDILPLPIHFSRDTNLPPPARRTRVDEFASPPRSNGGASVGGAGTSLSGVKEDENTWLGRKVRVYGRIVSYIESESIVILSDPDSPSPSIASSSSNRRPVTRPTIRINTSIISHQLYPFSSESIYPRARRPGGEGSDSEVDDDDHHANARLGSSSIHHRLARAMAAREATGGMGSRDLDSIGSMDGQAGGDVGVGRYPAGSGRLVEAHSTTITNAGERTLQGLKLDPGQAIEVVGWVQRGARGGWVIRAIHMFNVGAYVPPPPPPELARPPPLNARVACGDLEGDKEAGGRWERRKGLEIWD